jgi:hypothetical protein
MGECTCPGGVVSIRIKFIAPGHWNGRGEVRDEAPSIVEITLAKLVLQHCYSIDSIGDDDGFGSVPSRIATGSSGCSIVIPELTIVNKQRIVDNQHDSNPMSVRSVCPASGFTTIMKEVIDLVGRASRRRCSGGKTWK